MVLSRDYLPACPWQPTYSSKSVRTVGRIWTDMYFHPVFWWLSSGMSACAAWEGDTPQWDHVTTAQLPPGLVTEQQGNGSAIFPLRAGDRGDQGGCSKEPKLCSTMDLATCSSVHLWLPPGTLELFETHSASLHAGKRSAAMAPASKPGPLLWEWQLCGFKKELVHPAAEKPVDSAVFLPHFPFCGDLTLPQCCYSCRRSGTRHTKVSFSHINMSI